MTRICGFFLLMAVWLTACAPQVQPPTERKMPAQWSEAAFIASDGAELRARLWLPEGAPSAVILAVHGFNDYSHAFALPGRYFAQRGVAVAAFDQRGFGASPMTGIWAGGHFTSDIREAVTALRARYPGVPVFLLGESMGGALAVLALTDEGAPDVNGVILSAPALWGDSLIYGIYTGMVWTVAHTFPGKRFTGQGFKILATDNIPLLREMSVDPSVLKSARADTVYGLVGLMREARDRAPLLRAPVLLLYGQRDQVVPPEPVMAAANRLGDSCRVRIYPQGYHMLLRDTQRETVYQDILRWMAEVQPANVVNGND